MTAWDRIREEDEWTEGSPVRPSEMEAFDLHLSKAPNFAEGGAYAPSSPVEVGGAGLRTNVAPTTDDGVVNKAYLNPFLTNSMRLGPQVANPGLNWPVLDDGLGAIHVMGLFTPVSSYGKAKLVFGGLDGFPSPGPDPDIRVSAAQNPATGEIVVGRGAASSSNTNKLLSSTDRQNWTDIGGSLPSNTAPVFVWWTGNEFLTLHASSSAGQLRTWDGVSLTFVDAIGSPAGASDVFEMAFSPTTAVAIKRETPTAYHADLSDLTDWTNTSLPVGTLPYDIVYSATAELFYLCGRDANGPCLLSSPDGVTWTAVTITDPWPLQGTGGIMTSVCERYGQLVAVFYTEDDFTTPTNGSSHIGSSIDGGENWEMFDSLDDLVEIVRPAPTGIIAIGHAGSTSGVFISG